MNSAFIETCEVVLKYKDNRDIVVRKTVMNLFPVLAAYNPNVFVERYLHQTMFFLLAQLKKDRDRQAAYISVGRLSLTVGSSINPYLDAIIQNIRESLASKG
jgi:FKBP12-rapamycin complex-associated protein